MCIICVLQGCQYNLCVYNLCPPGVSAQCRGLAESAAGAFTSALTGRGTQGLDQVCINMS